MIGISFSRNICWQDEGGWELSAEIAAESISRLLSDDIQVCIGFCLDSYSLFNMQQESMKIGCWLKKYLLGR